MNDVTRRFRARPTINLMVTNNIERLCWPPAQLSGHLDFFQNKCRYCKYSSAGLQEISVQMKPHLERFSKSPTAKRLGCDPFGVCVLLIKGFSLIQDLFAEGVLGTKLYAGLRFM